MLKATLYIIFISCLLLVNPIKLMADTTPNDTLNYDRIYKQEGIWYGVIDITSSKLTGWNCHYGKCYGNAIYIEFSRNTENLTSITYNYKEQDICKGPTLFGICLGTKKEGASGTETVFDKTIYGNFLDYLLNTEKISKLYTGNYDYRIISENENLFDSVEIITFTYILTNEEIDDVLLNLQTQYDRELDYILDDDTTTFEEKEAKLLSLNLEYREYKIRYGEDLTSLCLNHETCQIDTTNSITFPDITALKDFLALILIIAFIVITLILVGIHAITDLFELIIKSFITFAQGLAYLIHNYIWKPFYKGFSLLVNTLFHLIFWWI